jgi:rubrerythrin
MKCWNCGKTLPKGAKTCSYCENKQDDPSAELIRLQEKLKTNGLSPGEREEVENLVEELRAVIEQLDVNTREELQQLVKDSATAEEFAAAIFVGSCPKCESSETEDCEEVFEIENPLVGRCKKCSTLFCTECGQIYQDDKITEADARCPSCGSLNTTFEHIQKLYEEERFEEAGYNEVYECLDCNRTYCSNCGKPTQT